MINRNQLFFISSVFIVAIGMILINNPQRPITTYVINENVIIRTYKDTDTNKIESLLCILDNENTLKVARDNLNFMEISKNKKGNWFNIHIQYWSHEAYYDDYENVDLVRAKNIIENYYWWNWPNGKKWFIKFH
jgi:hypothetical protein